MRRATPGCLAAAAAHASRDAATSATGRSRRTMSILRWASAALLALTALGAACAQEASPARASDQQAIKAARESDGAAIYSPFSAGADRRISSPKQAPIEGHSPDMTMTLLAGLAGGAALVWLLRQ